MNDLPKYLYHYTSIENLSLILRNKTLRFIRLDKVNDPDEAITKHFPNAKYFLYVSCWTSEKEETLPMWKMYSNDMKGVRIRLPINIFQGRRLPEYESTSYPIIHTDGNIRIKLKELTSQGLLVGPQDVKYSNNPENTDECFTVLDDDLIKVDLLHIGLLKNFYWEYEQEWRYRIFASPVEGTWPKSVYDKYMEGIISKYIDLPLGENIFSELIIQLGPRATLAESLIVGALCKEYAPNGPKLCDSSIKISG